MQICTRKQVPKVPQFIVTVLSGIRKHIPRFFSFFLDEMQIVTRARNHKTNSSPKNTDIITYKNATGLEALVGYLYLEGNNERIVEIMNYIKER